MNLIITAPNICPFVLTIIILWTISAFAGCTENAHRAAAFSTYRPDQQKLLTGSESSTSSVKNVIELPLQRRFVQYRGRFYFTGVSVGSPTQSLELVVDTGSTDTWVYDSGSHCDGKPRSDHFQCYEPRNSSTAEIIPPPPYFEASYPNLYMRGVYVKDNFVLEKAKLKSVEFGMVREGEGPDGGGLIGLGFDTAQHCPNNTFCYMYPDIMDSLYNQSLIDSRSFGMYLNNGSVPEYLAKGSLVFGGYDKSRLSGPFVPFTIDSPSDIKRLGAPLTTITAVLAGVQVPVWTAAQDANIQKPSIPAVFDSGDMIAEIPVDAHVALIRRLNTFQNGMLIEPKPGEKFNPIIECQHGLADVMVNFTFAALETNITISVRFSELVLPSPWGQNCWFALWPKRCDLKKPYWVNIGSSVVGSMYLMVDYDKNTIHLGQANYSPSDPNIIPVNHRLGNLF